MGLFGFTFYLTCAARWACASKLSCCCWVAANRYYLENFICWIEVFSVGVIAEEQPSALG